MTKHSMHTCRENRELEFALALATSGTFRGSSISPTAVGF